MRVKFLTKILKTYGANAFFVDLLIQPSCMFDIRNKRFKIKKSFEHPLLLWAALLFVLSYMFGYNKQVHCTRGGLGKASDGGFRTLACGLLKSYVD